MNINKKYQKVVYLHGLESPQGGPKVDYLSSKFTVYAPKMDYFDNPENIFNDQLKLIKEFNPDLIIGSSMGGYFSDRIGSHIGCDLLLFNPGTIKADEFDKEYGIKTKKGNLKCNTKVVLGIKDDVVDPGLSKEHYDNKAKIHLHPFLGHRIPQSLFEAQIEKLEYEL
tara:strand:+ start:1117 stop:1620 length:504 start_codon:yes stop_codon:yes gene_type:complete